MIKTLLFSLFLVLAATQTQATDRYVIPGAGGTGCSNGSSNYSAASNTCGAGSSLVYTSAQNAADVAVAGDFVYFRAGTYDSGSSNTLDPANSGTAGNPITFKSYPGEAPVLQKDTNGFDNTAVLMLIGKSFITFDGLKIVGGDYAILVYLNSSDNQFLNLEITGSWRSVAIRTFSHRNLVKNCKIYDNIKSNWPRGFDFGGTPGGGAWGAALSAHRSSHDNIFEDNYVYWNHGEGISVGIESARSIIRRNVSADNWSANIYNDGSGPGSVMDSNFVYLSEDAKNWPCAAPCYVGNQSMSVGIAASVESDSPVSSLLDMRVTNNIVIGTNGGFRTFRMVPGLTYSTWSIANNTFINNGNGIIFDNRGDPIDNMTITNNIVIEDGPPFAGPNPDNGLCWSGFPTCLAINLDPIPTNSTWSNNIFLTSSANAYVYNGNFRTYAETASTLSFTNSTNGVDPALVDRSYTLPRFWSDPSLSAPSAIIPFATLVAHYGLTAGSIAINAGVTMPGFTNDILATVRPLGERWDIGSLESGSPDSLPPSIAITAPSSSPTFATPNATLSLSGTASDNQPLLSVTWKSTACGSGTAAGTSTWSIALINLPLGVCVVTVTANDSDGFSTSDVITVTRVTPQLVLQMGMDEGTGTAVADSSGFSNNGTISNATWTTLGRYGNALAFDGTGDVVTVADSASLDLLIYTIEAWVQPTTLNLDFAAILRKSDDYYFYATTGAGYCGLGAILAGYDSGGVQFTSCYPTQLSPNTWTHVAATYDGINIRIYVNSILVTITAAGGNVDTSAGALTIGLTQYGEGFIGIMDELRIYNHARTQLQILANMNQPIAVIATAPAIKFSAGSAVLKCAAVAPCLKLSR